MLQLFKNIWIMQFLVVAATYLFAFGLKFVCKRFRAEDLSQFFFAVFLVFGSICFFSIEMVNLVSVDNANVLCTIIRTVGFILGGLVIESLTLKH